MRSVPGVNAPLGYNFRARNVARPGAEVSADGLRPGSQSTLAHTMPASTGSTVTSSTAQPQTLQVPHNRGGRTDDGKSGSVLGSSVGSQQPGFRAPPNTPLNKTSIPSLGLNTLGGPDPIPKMMSMSLKEEDEDEEKDEADNETHGNDRDKHTGVFELEM
ncbi:hypothetical protein IWQ60_010478 [Tieghemiomyces parasiticus]|uniref:Uncharacterized protein n=1 Tax=Tieghemiomyces parasiticus TaxID=78921 RepID=A0A9W7ZQF3_9FUNG|nr:hypothetical protein IWQ60_010478 [Tieghemiomyces parasiticus]